METVPPTGQASMEQPTLSIVIPVYNGGNSFKECLLSLKQYAPKTTQVIVVVDGGTDDSEAWAREFGATVFKFPNAGGPARARNLGAKAATGDILFFMDADVTLAADTLDQIVQHFNHHPDTDALIGSYDDEPGSKNFLSQYKNLFHHYTHQTACEEASTFWGACGAVRKEVFFAVGGFDETYRYPSIEDIELGYRLKRAGYTIRLCKTVYVKHLKRWEPWSLLRAEVLFRALPWTELLWRDRQFINDLNLQTSSRVSVVLAFSLLLSSAVAVWWLPSLAIAAIAGLILLWLNWSVYRFFLQKRGLWFTIRVIPWHWLYFLYSGLSFALGTVFYHLFQANKRTPTPISPA
jgi:GT2 family glycosyltransferase